MRFTVGNNSGSESFDGTSAETLEDTSTEDRSIGSCKSSPDVGTEEKRESGNERRSFPQDESKGDPHKVAQSQGEDVVIGQEGDLIDRHSENAGVRVEKTGETG